MERRSSLIGVTNVKANGIKNISTSSKEAKDLAILKRDVEIGWGSTSVSVLICIALISNKFQRSYNSRRIRPPSNSSGDMHDMFRMDKLNLQQKMRSWIEEDLSCVSAAMITRTQHGRIYTYRV